MEAARTSPSPSAVSPIFSKIFLYQVLDKWFEEEARRCPRGNCQLVRFADDIVVALEDHYGGKRLLDVPGKRVDTGLRPMRPRRVIWTSAGDALMGATGMHRLRRSTSLASSASGGGRREARTSFARSRRKAVRRVRWNRCTTGAGETGTCRSTRCTTTSRGRSGAFAHTTVLRGTKKFLNWFRYRVERTWRKWLEHRSRLRCMT